MTIDVAGFEVFEELGRGGFGVVYRARQLAFDRPAAVKVLLPRGPVTELERTFARECRAVGSLRAHPNVVSVYSTGTTDDGNQYLAMQYLAGGSLSDRVPLRADAVAALGIRLADGLGVAHAAGIVHRDVKPSNVLFDDEDEPVLVDFGISALSGETSTTARHVAVSIGYAPPEVLDGARPSPAADIYALGATLFTAASGRVPYVSDDGHTSLAVLAARILTQPVPDLRPAGVPDALCSVIERCMAKDPAARYASTAELRDALVVVAGNEVTVRTVSELWGADAPSWQPVDVDTVPGPEASRRWRRGRCRRTVAVAAAVLVAAGVAVAAAAAGDDRTGADAAPGSSTPLDGSSGSRPVKGTAPGIPAAGAPGPVTSTTPVARAAVGTVQPPAVVAGGAQVAPPVVTSNGGSGGGTTRRTTTVANRAPRLAALPTVSAGETQQVSVTFAASDADGDALRYRVSGLPSGLDSSGARVSGSVPAGGVNLTSNYRSIRTATYTVSVTVTDSKGASDAASVTWTIRDDHLTMPNYIGRYGCNGDPNCSEDVPNVDAIGTHVFSCAVDPSNVDRIVRQSPSPGTVVSWGGRFGYTYAATSC